LRCLIRFKFIISVANIIISIYNRITSITISSTTVTICISYWPSKRPEFDLLIGDNTDDDLNQLFLWPLLGFAMLGLSVYLESMSSTGGYSSRRSDSDGDTSDDLLHVNNAPTVNIDGTPMVGDVDVHGNVYGVTVEDRDDLWKGVEPFSANEGNGF